MTLSDLFIVCSHGRRSAHNEEIPCPQNHDAFNFEGERVQMSCTVRHYVMCQGGRPATLGDLEGLGIVVIVPDEDGDAPDWFYDVVGKRLSFVGGTDQWKFPDYRMAYAAVVWKALKSHFIPILLPESVGSE